MKPSLSEEGGAERRVMGRECEDCRRQALSPFLKEFRKSLENRGGVWRFRRRKFSAGRLESGVLGLVRWY